ncbi:O-antigen polymerase [Lachnospiraceae bacterium 54-53]
MQQCKDKKFMKTRMSSLAIALLGILFIILPEYFAFEIGTLPSFTASRIIILLIFLLVLLSKRPFILPINKCAKVLYFLLAVLIAVDISHVSVSSTYAINDAFSLIYDCLLLVILIVHFVRTEDEIDKLLSYIVKTSLVLSAFGVIEFLTGFNICSVLSTSSRDVLQATYERLGMRRSASAFGHAVYYGVYCTSVIPFALYLFDKYKKRIYLVCVIANIVGVLVSGSRGQMLSGFVVLLLFYFTRRKKEKWKYTKYFLIILGVFAFLCLIVPSLRIYISENIKSIMANFGLQVMVSANFGGNTKGVSSRWIQLSGIRWLIMNGKFVLGYGPAAAYRGLVSYYWTTSGWHTIQSVDIGYVGWFLYYGIIGAIAEGFFYAFYLFDSIKRRKKNTSDLFNAFWLFFASYLLNLATSTGVSKLLWVLVGLYISACQIRNRSGGITK